VLLGNVSYVDGSGPFYGFLTLEFASLSTLGMTLDGKAAKRSDGSTKHVEAEGDRRQRCVHERDRHRRLHRQSSGRAREPDRDQGDRERSWREQLAREHRGVVMDADLDDQAAEAPRTSKPFGDEK
jgi:hypothetical protein